LEIPTEQEPRLWSQRVEAHLRLSHLFQRLKHLRKRLPPISKTGSKTASRKTLSGCDLFIPKTAEAALSTVKAPNKAIIKAKSSIQALHLIIIAQFAPILSVSP